MKYNLSSKGKRILKQNLLQIIKMQAEKHNYNYKILYKYLIDTNYLLNKYSVKLFKEYKDIDKEIFDFLNTEESKKFILEYLKFNIKHYTFELSEKDKYKLSELTEEQIEYIYDNMKTDKKTNILCPRDNEFLYTWIHNGFKYLKCGKCHKPFNKKESLEIQMKEGD